eukprot:6177985-Pleurochrysis_carterae.AAC.5
MKRNRHRRKPLHGVGLKGPEAGDTGARAGGGSHALARAERGCGERDREGEVERSEETATDTDTAAARQSA